jgi:hypothetical protein
MPNNRFLASLLVLMMVFLTKTPVWAQATSGSTKATWQISQTVGMVIVPNYATGYGPIGGTGSGTTAAVGSSASLGGGYVDFGTVVVGYSYLYKNAAQVQVQTNDPNGFSVYAEGSTDFSDGAGHTLPIDNSLYWLQSSSSNGPFTPATSFHLTSATVGGGGTTLTYSGTPTANALMWNFPTSTSGQPSATASKGFDYQLRLPSSAPAAYTMTLYVVYTVTPN